MVISTEHPRYGQVRQVASPVRVGPAPASYRRAPRRNEDHGYLTSELLGYSAQTLAELAAGGAFGPVAG
jgi:crotonobetainyl-CoA:carnitine CoA-transferase CaiB-like acyl-CoA transferase